jgi:hypothetical protein
MSCSVTQCSRNHGWSNTERLWLFHLDVSQEFGPPFLVFLTCDFPGGISSLQELQGRLHLAVGGPPYGHHEREEQGPQEHPENPPQPMHSPKIVHSFQIMKHITPADQRQGFLSANAPTYSLASRQIPLSDIGIPQEGSSPFFVLHALNLSSGISPFQQLQGSLHLPVS